MNIHSLFKYIINIYTCIKILKIRTYNSFITCSNNISMDRIFISQDINGE